jgi:hypothetical protein
LEGNNANHYTSHADDINPGLGQVSDMRGQNVLHCILRGSNPRGLCPLGLKSSALTTRPRMRVRNTWRRADGTQKGWCSQSETRTHNLPVNSRARCRLRHSGTCTYSWNRKCRKRYVPPAGIEPATNRLKVERST